MEKNKKPKQDKSAVDAAAKSIPALKKNYLSLLLFIALGVLIFYPPYFRGLFFAKEIFITHIITAAIFIFIWIDKIKRKDYGFIQTPLDWAMLAYAGAYLLSLFGAIHIGDAIYGFLKALNYFMIYWMLSQVVKNYRDYESILKILVASGLGVAGIGILAATGYSNYPSAFDGQHISSTLQYFNTTAAYLAVLSLIVVTLWIRESKLGMKVVYGIAAYLMILVVMAAISKGAWLIFFAGIILLLIGMPGVYKIKSVYSMGLALLAAMITASKFIPAISSEEQAKGLPLLLIGVGIVIVGQLIWEGLLLVHQRKGRNFTAGIIAVLLILIIAGTGLSGMGQKLLPENMGVELTQISDLQDNSYITRYDFSRWGLAIVKDHPVVGTGAGGWNALYHQYQDYLFWTTETHNHFMQVWVESGTLGLLAFIAMWLLLINAGWKIYHLKKENASTQSSDEWILLWGTVSTALTFGLHAAIDFDLSLGSMAILLWSLFGLINAGYKMDIKEKIFMGKMSINLTAAAVMAAVLLFMGSSFAIASVNAEKGAQAAQNLNADIEESEKEQELDKAIGYFEKASSADKWSGSYQADLARCYTIKFKKLYAEKDNSANSYYQNAKEAVLRAEKLAPRNIDLSKSLLESCMLLGDGPGQVRQAETALLINPNDNYAYENMAKVSIALAAYYMDNDKSEEGKVLLEKTSVLQQKMDEQKAKIRKDRPWQGEKLKLSAPAKLAVAKSSYFLGKYNETDDIVDAMATNMLAMEFKDVGFENTSFENASWKVSVVDDEDAENGKCVQIEAKKDMVNWQTAINIGKKIPVLAGSEYEFSLRYKVLNCEDNLTGKSAHNLLGVWSHWHTKDKVIPSDYVFWDENKGSSSDGWKVYSSKTTAPEGSSYKHFKLGTGSVKKGTTYRVDYIKFIPSPDSMATHNIEEARIWHAACQYKLGNRDKALELIKQIDKHNPQAVKTFNYLINLEAMQ